MNIDLLFTDQGEVGLVSDAPFAQPVAGLMYDTLSGQITLEFGDADPFDLNIPVDIERGADLHSATTIQIGIIRKGVITENRTVPVVLLNDPFGGGNAGYFAAKPSSSVMALESFMKRAVAGQPVHRDDLGDEARAGSILGGINPAVLQFSPQLARQKTMEAAPKAAPSAPAPMGPGGMGGGGGAARPVQPRPPAPKRDDDGGSEQ